MMKFVQNIIAKNIYFSQTVKDKLIMRKILQKKEILVKRMRLKKKIKVLFVLHSLSKWKTESLYIAMLGHPRFEPIIGVALGVFDYPSQQFYNLCLLKDYLKGKRYDYMEIRVTNDIQENIFPDIVFYQQADGGIFDDLLFYQLHDILFCYISYGFSYGVDLYAYNTMYHNVCWHWFVENQMVKDYGAKIMNNHAVNMTPTGTPMMDELLEEKEKMVDPWKKQTRVKKRIIWASHHTIGIGKEEIHYGTFLDVADRMIELAKKYSNEIQWAFKPHPSLKQKLYYLWGEQRTNDYYNFWKDSEYTQLETGKYVELFKYSDAMIHDCGSFTTEYLYMHNPCMYLINGKNHPLNKFGQACYDQYYKGYNIEDIEQFVLNVLHEIDPMKDRREKFFAECLLPPNGKTACENIIDCILGM